MSNTFWINYNKITKIVQQKIAFKCSILDKIWIELLIKENKKYWKNSNFLF